MLTEDEYIICAAIWFDDGVNHQSQPKNISHGYVVCGFRHNNIIALHHQLTGKTLKDFKYVQGFLTSHNTFVNRFSAKCIAEQCKQIGKNTFAELTSEDIY